MTPQTRQRLIDLCLRALAGSSRFFVPDPAVLARAQSPVLPPGHPERMTLGMPPTAEERLLWAQFAASPAGRR